MSFKPNLDYKGSPNDLKWLSQEKWLKDAVVGYYISHRRGRYWVHITFHNPNNPLQIKVKTIDHYPRRKTAEQFAAIFQRGIQKDPRGTLKTNNNAFHICAN